MNTTRRKVPAIYFTLLNKQAEVEKKGDMLFEGECVDLVEVVLKRRGEVKTLVAITHTGVVSSALV